MADNDEYVRERDGLAMEHFKADKYGNTSSFKAGYDAGYREGIRRGAERSDALREETAILIERLDSSADTIQKLIDELNQIRGRKNGN